MTGVTIESEPRTRSSSFRMMLLLAGSFLLQTVQLGVFPIAMAQLLAGVGHDAGTIGVFLALMWAAVLLLGPLVPRLMRWMGDRGSNALGYCLTFLALVCLLSSHAVVAIAAASTFMGAGLIVRWVLCDTLVIRLSSKKHRGRAIGLHEALMGLGIGCGPLLFVALSLQHVVLAALLLCVLGAVCFITMDTMGSDLHGLAGGARQKPRKSSRIRAFVAGAPILLLAFGAANLSGFIESSSIALLPLSFEARGFSLPQAALLVSAFGFGGTILQPPLGWIADKFGYAAAQAICVGVMLATCLATLFTDNMGMLLTTLFFMGAAAGGFNTLAVIQAGNALPESKIPTAMTWIALFYTCGSIVGPIAAGYAVEHAPAVAIYWVFFTMTAAMGLALAIWLLWRMRPRGTPSTGSVSPLVTRPPKTTRDRSGDGR